MSSDQAEHLAREMASASEVEDFLHSALVSWIESFVPRPELITGYESLLDGKIIHSIWQQIDPEPQNQLISLAGLEGSSLANGRMKNFDAIIKNLKWLYEDELGQMILKLPDCYILGFLPDSKAGLEQMKLLMTMLLGAAVQCPNKQLFIERIKELDVNTQHEIVEIIKQVTDTQSLVLQQDTLEALSPSAMYNHIIMLARERDSYYSKWICSLTNDGDVALADSNNSANNSNFSSSGVSIATCSSAESNHMAVELADFKGKIRRLRQELEEKTESYIEIKEELDYKTSQCEKLRAESQQWYTEAKKAAAYRDEIDILRERAERADRLEIDIQKLREKLTDAEFYKSRVEELREDNRMLLETKDMLEEQLLHSRKRSELVMGLESEIIKYRQKLNDMVLERDMNKNKLQELLEENTQLQLLTSKNAMSRIEDENNTSENEDYNSGDNSLSDQLSNDAHKRALKLELENQRLLATLEQIRESSFHESANKILESEKEKKMLALKLDQLQENYTRISQQNKELEEIFKNALEENKKIQEAVDVWQKAFEKQSQEREIERSKIISLESNVENTNKEKQRIQSLFESVQRRAEDTERLLEAKSKEVESLQETILKNEEAKVGDLQSKIENLEKENNSLTREVSKLKENLEAKSVTLDEYIVRNDVQSKDILKLQKEIEESMQNIQKVHVLEKQSQELLTQRKIDQETIETLRRDLVAGTLATNTVKHNLEKLGLDDLELRTSDMRVEHVVEKMVENPETFKTVCEVLLNCSKQNKKSDMCVLCHTHEIFTVEKNIEIQDDGSQIAQIVESSDNKEEEQLRSNNLSLKIDNENLRSENAKLNVYISTLSSQITSLNTQHVALQLANSQLAADKDSLLKQIETIQQHHSVLLQDQGTLQCLHNQLSIEYESLRKDKESLKSLLRDVKIKNRNLKESVSSLEKTVDSLKSEMSQMKSSVDDLIVLRVEHSKLTEDFKNLFATSERFKAEYKNIQEQYKMLRTNQGRMKLQNFELTGELNAKNDQLNSLEVEYAKVLQRCDMLLQLNSNLDSDRKTLMENVSQLLSQYHELLTHSLEDKQHYHDEEKNYTDRVNSLNRQKEKLEEKIMEHYKKSESCAPKKKAFGSSFVRRVKKASSDLINKVPSRHRRSWVDDIRLTQPNFNFGSESGGNESDNSLEEPSFSSTSFQMADIPLKNNPRGSHMESPLLEIDSNRKPPTNRGDTNTSRKNRSVGLETPDVPESCLTLGTAGSRRTVYLVEDNQKLPEPTPESVPGEHENSSNEKQQSTYLIYNKIQTIMSDVGGMSTNALDSGGTDGIDAKDLTSDDKFLSREQKEEKSNSIWYEYGCV